MAKKKNKGSILNLKTDNEKLIGEMITKAESGDFYSAFVCYSRIEEDKKYMALPFISGIYSKLNAVNYEVDSLLKLLTYPKFKDYNPQALLYRVYNFFNSFMGLEVYEHYEQLLKKNFKNTPQAFLLEGETKSNLPFEHLRLVDDNGKFYYEQALICLKSDNLEGANKWLKKIKPTDEYFYRAKNLQSIINLMVGRIDEAEKVCLELLDYGGNNSEALASLMQIAKLNPERKKEIYERIINANDCGNLSSKLVKADCYLENGDFENAILILETVKGNSRFEENFLDKLSNLYLLNGNKQKAEYYLKILVAIYPKNFRARFALKKLSKTSGTKVTESVLGGKIKNELSTFFNLSHTNFLALDERELQYYFCIARFYGGIEKFKQLCLIYLTSTKATKVLMDGLIEVETSEKYRQILLSTIIQAGVKGKFYCLVIGKLRELEIEYPKTLYNEFIVSEANLQNLDESKVKDISFITHLINCFSQAYSLCLYSGFDMKNFGKLSDKLSKALIALDEVGRDMFSSIDNCVFAFCYNYNKCFAERQFVQLFVDISEEMRGKIISFINFEI